MRKIIGYSLSILILSSVILMCTTVFGADEPTITVNKTTFAVGEKISVSFSNLDASVYGAGAIELRMYKPDDVPGTHSSTDYMVVHSGTVDLGSSGTIDFPEDGARTEVTSYAAGRYKLFLYHDTQKIISNTVMIDITGDITLSTNKTKYDLNEDISVSYSNIAASLGGNDELFLGLYKENDVVGTNASTDYIMLFKKATGVNRTHAGTVKFPADGGRNKTSYDPGRYKIILVKGNKAVGDPVYLSIDEPSITLNKSIYTPGESFEVTYSKAYASYDKGAGMEIRIYKPGDTPGLIASQDYVILRNSSQGIALPESGTVIFPRDGGRNKTVYEPGTYVMMLVYANTPICESVTFKVASPITLSTDKTEYSSGDDIKVTYANVDNLYDQGQGLEIRIYKQGDEPGKIASQDYAILHNTTKNIDLPDSGVISFPDDGERNKTEYLSGTYVVMLLYGNTSICDPVTIKITAPQPKISINKSSYAPGEVIKVTYTDVLKSYDQGQGLEIRIYKHGDTPGVIASQDYVVLHNTAKGIDILPSGTLSFPGDGVRDKKVYGTGTYEVMLLYANTPIGDAITFTVTENPATGDAYTLPVLFMFIMSLSTVLVIKKKRYFY